MAKTFRLVASLALIAPLFVPWAAAAQNEAQDVRNAVLGFSTDWNHHDMEAFGKLFAPDADFVNVGGFLMKGREQIQLHHSWSHGTIPADRIPGANRAHYGIFKHSTLHFNHIDVRLLRKDVAIARVNWELFGDSRTAKPRRGLLIFVLTRENGPWLIAAGQNTEINCEVH